MNHHTELYNGVFTLSETDTETDNKCTELNGNPCCYLSWCSVKCSAYYSGTHNYRSRYRYHSRSRCRSMRKHHKAKYGLNTNRSIQHRCGRSFRYMKQYFIYHQKEFIKNDQSILRQRSFLRQLALNQ